MKLELTDRQATNLQFTIEQVLDSWTFDGDKENYELEDDLKFVNNLIKENKK